MGANRGYVLENGVIRKRMVSTALSSGGTTQVTDGLSDGELVLLNLPDALSEGDAAEAVISSDF